MTNHDVRALAEEFWEALLEANAPEREPAATSAA